MPGFFEPGLQNLGWTPFEYGRMGIAFSNLNTEYVPHRQHQTDEA